MKFDAIFLDRDGTISHDPYGYINDVKDYDFFDFTFEALELLHQYSDKFFIVTNQSGLSTGKIDINNLYKKKIVLKKQLMLQKIAIYLRNNQIIFQKNLYFQG